MNGDRARDLVYRANYSVDHCDGEPAIHLRIRSSALLDKPEIQAIQKATRIVVDNSAGLRIVVEEERKRRRAANFQQ